MKVVNTAVVNLTSSALKTKWKGQGHQLRETSLPFFASSNQKLKLTLQSTLVIFYGLLPDTAPKNLALSTKTLSFRSITDTWKHCFFFVKLLAAHLDTESFTWIWKQQGKAKFSFVMSACNNSAHTGRIFVKLGILLFFYFGENSNLITIWKGSDVSLHEEIATISSWSFLRMGNRSDKIVEKIKTHILCLVIFPENRAVYEIM